MKKMNDEELQKWFDEIRSAKQGGIDLMNDNAQAYQFLFDVLDTEPAESLPYNFAAEVTRKVQSEAKHTSELRYYIGALVVFAVAVAALFGISGLVKPGANLDYVNGLMRYKWPVVLVIFSFLTIQYLDQVLVKVKMFRNSSKM